MRVDIERQWLGHADGISKLNGAARGEASCDDILGKVARDIRGGTVDLCRVLARKRAAAMRSCAAISINDDLASGQASIAIRSANFKAAGRVDVIVGFGQQACWKQVGDDALHIIVQLRLFFALVISRCMLGGDDNRGCSFRLAFAVITQSDLAFGVRLQKRCCTRMTVSGHTLEDLVAVIQRGGHQVRRLCRCIAKHDALVASAFILVATGVYALGNMCRLAVQVIFKTQGFPVEALLRIADFLDGAADSGFDFFFGAFGPCAIFIDAFAANLASEDNQLRRSQCFARDARFGVF